MEFIWRMRTDWAQVLAYDTGPGTAGEDEAVITAATAGVEGV